MDSTKEQQEQRERERQERERAQQTRTVPRPAPGKPRERDEADKRAAEMFSSPPDAPTPTQDEADEYLERALTNWQNTNVEPAQQRDIRPAEGRSGYTTR